MENFRNLLVMEEGQSLWVARATPRSWLQQGKRIAVKNAPTHFGVAGYEIVSDVEHGKIAAARRKGAHVAEARISAQLPAAPLA